MFTFGICMASIVAGQRGFAFALTAANAQAMSHASMRALAKPGR